MGTFMYILNFCGNPRTYKIGGFLGGILKNKHKT
jgi:hypothetical protein